MIALSKRQIFVVAISIFVLAIRSTFVSNMNVFALVLLGYGSDNTISLFSFLRDFTITFSPDV